MNIRIAVSAKKDLERIRAYYDRQRPGLGSEFLGEVGETIRALKQFPHARPEFHAGTRRLLLNRFPYGAVYRVKEHEILIVLVAHLKRAPKFWQRRSKAKD